MFNKLLFTVLGLSSAMCFMSAFFFWRAVDQYENAHEILQDVIDLLIKEKHSDEAILSNEGTN